MCGKERLSHIRKGVCVWQGEMEPHREGVCVWQGGMEPHTGRSVCVARIDGAT